MAASLSGQLIVLDGPEGGGKTTQGKRLVDHLRQCGKRAHLVHDPGSTELSEKIRQMVLDPTIAHIDPRTEVLLYMASRAEMVAEVIEPALKQGQIIVCDRFVSSTVAYQGYGAGVPPDAIWEMWQLLFSGLEPDLTIILDLAVEEGFTRIHGKKVLPDSQIAFSFHRDRMESKDRAFHEKVRQGFLAMAEERPDRFAVVDASRPPDDVARSIAEAVTRVLR